MTLWPVVDTGVREVSGISLETTIPAGGYESCTLSSGSPFGRR
jgi:hypothetical protein